MILLHVLLPVRADGGSEEAAAKEGEVQTGGSDLQCHAGLEPAHPATVGLHVRPLCIFVCVLWKMSVRGFS